MKQVQEIIEEQVRLLIGDLFPRRRRAFITEGKSYATRRTFSDEKSILMNTLVRLVGSLKGNLDQKLIKDSIAAYDDLKDEFKDALFGLLKSYQDNEIDDITFKKLFRKEIRQAWGDAYEAGVGAAGNPFGVYDEDKTWLKGAEAEEFDYLSGFIQDMENDEGVMDYEKRMEMYVDTLDHAYYHGKVEGSPDEVEIEWVLGPAEHCEDCVELADNSPYTKDTLPTVPGAGDTRCLCITTPSSRVLTRRGWIPISDIEIGDYILTHRNRWKCVLATPRNPSKPLHRQAYIRGTNGQWIGCTSDHRFLTMEGWKDLIYIDRHNLSVYLRSDGESLSRTIAHGRGTETKTLTPERVTENRQACMDLRDLQENIPCIPKICGWPSKAQTILFSEMLPLGTILYDLTVEDDHSFIIEGLVTHNSNCKCELKISQTGETFGAQPGISGITTPRPPRIPSGKRLPTYQEYEKISSIQAEIDRINGMIDATSGKTKTALIADYRDLVHQRVATMGDDIYYVPKSNYFEGSGNFMEESLQDPIRPPAGYRSPSDKEKVTLDKMILEMNETRKRIINESNGNKKQFIAQRHKMNQQIIEYLDRHNIWYLPGGLMPTVGLRYSRKAILAEGLAKGITKSLFGDRI